MRELFRTYLAKTLGIDDPELQEELIGEYNRMFNDSVAQMKQAADAADFERLRRLGHALKGCASNIGHQEAHESALAVEMGARGGDAETCRTEIEKLAAIGLKLE